MIQAIITSILLLILILLQYRQYRIFIEVLNESEDLMKTSHKAIILMEKQQAMNELLSRENQRLKHQNQQLMQKIHK